jgi:hypothetical protein
MSLIYKGSSGLAKVGVASSSLVSRSKFKTLQSRGPPLFPPALLRDGPPPLRPQDPAAKLMLTMRAARWRRSKACSPRGRTRRAVAQVRLITCTQVQIGASYLLSYEMCA